jgi:hypothetical protein
VLILLSLIGAIATHSHHGTAADTNPTPTTQAQAVTALANPMPPPQPRSTPRSKVQGQDRYYHTIRFREYERQQRLTRPAYQHLPYRTSQVRIAITNVTSDGRLVLSVTPLGSNISPQVEYGTFLAHYHDPGSAYLPAYGRYGK